MKIDFSTPIRDIHGNAMQDGTTIATVCASALLAPDKNGNPPGDEMLARYTLAQRIAEGGEAEITSSEATRILSCLEKTHTTLVYGQLHGILEGTGEAAKPNGKEAARQAQA